MNGYQNLMGCIQAGIEAREKKVDDILKTAQWWMEQEDLLKSETNFGEWLKLEVDAGRLEWGDISRAILERF